MGRALIIIVVRHGGVHAKLYMIVIFVCIDEWPADVMHATAAVQGHPLRDSRSIGVREETWPDATRHHSKFMGSPERLQTNVSRVIFVY